MAPQHWFRRLWSLFRRRHTERDMDDEMRSHIAHRKEQYLRMGLPAGEAERQSRVRFGGLERVKDECREARHPMYLEEMWRDTMSAFRSVRRALAFSSTVVGTIALCLWTNATVYSVLSALILKPLPFSDASQLVEVYNRMPQAGAAKRPVSVAQYLDYRENLDAFETTALWRTWTFNIGAVSEPERGIGAMVTGSYFQMLGLQPLLGRFFSDEECVDGRDKVIVLTQTYWESQFKRDSNIVGQILYLDGEPFTILGVAPRVMEQFNAHGILLKPYVWPSFATTPRTRAAFVATMYGRMKRGTNIAEAQAQLAVLEARFLKSDAPVVVRDILLKGGHSVAVGNVRVEQTHSIRAGLIVLQAGAACVLLLGCFNVASLFLIRSAARSREFAVREALGAGWGRLSRQLYVEASVLSLLGGLTALALTWGALRFINRYTQSIVREALPVHLDLSTAGLMLVAVAIVALVSSGLSIVRITGCRATNMASGTRGFTSDARTRKANSMLVIAQVALAMMLLVAASLLVRSYAAALNVDLGFQTRRLVEGRVALNSTYKDASRIQATQQLILEKLRNVPGIESVSYASNHVIGGNASLGTVPLRGVGLEDKDSLPTAHLLAVSPEFFRTLGLRIVDGREFTSEDNSNSRRALIVDRQFADKYYPGRSPVGEALDPILPGEDPNTTPLIVGVVERAKFNGPEDMSGVPFVYMSFSQQALGGWSVVLRTSRAEADVLRDVRTVLREVDPSLPLYAAGSVAAQLDDTLIARRGIMWLLIAFASVAALLAGVGLYGALAYEVSLRSREIGIRGAIGATRSDIVNMILAQGIRRTSVGVVLGLVGSLVLSRSIAGVLFGVRYWDFISYSLTTCVLLFVTFVACLLPARRAAKVDPSIALRAE